MIFDFILKPTISFALLGQIASVDLWQRNNPVFNGTENVLVKESGALFFDYVSPYKQAAVSSNVEVPFSGLYALCFIAWSDAFEWIIGGNEVVITQYNKKNEKTWEDRFSFRNIFGETDINAYCHFYFRPESRKINVAFLMKNLQSDLEIKNIRLYMLRANFDGDN